MSTFALIGAAGFVAPRHLAAMREVGGNLLAAADPSDSVGVLDKYFPRARFFTETERFDRFLEKLRLDGAPADYVSVCSPNYLHDAHVRLALRVGAHAICEKPLVISPWNLDALAKLEEESGRRVYSIQQLRLLPPLIALQNEFATSTRRAQVELHYTTPRGPWYQVSWKGNDERSGGIALNIGVHFFDLLLWIFGSVESVELLKRSRTQMRGTLQLARADVSWTLSLDEADLPAGHVGAYRLMSVDGEPIDLSSSFEDLHTASYRAILAGNGTGIEDARPAIELVHRLRGMA